jgi:phospholipid/cholesterol/gamma-HCH transport system substrate-binding protein
MANTTTRNIRLGVFVTTGILLLISALYFIGVKRNLFGSTIRISARFHNVNGLMQGNNVRFAGIDVGTVESVQIINDSQVNVVMIIERDVQQFIRKNSLAAVGTDGLMGNKLVNINAAGDGSTAVEDGDILPTLRPIETDEMIRTLNTTNENVRLISDNLKSITQRINNSQSFWSLLSDSSIAEDIRESVAGIRLASERTASITGEVEAMTRKVREGHGTLGTLLTDTALAGSLQRTVAEMDDIGRQLSTASDDIRSVTAKINRGEGAVGALIMDTTIVPELNTSIQHIREGSQDFSEMMNALRDMWPFHQYFKKMENQKEEKP